MKVMVMLIIGIVLGTSMLSLGCLDASAPAEKVVYEPAEKAVYEPAVIRVVISGVDGVYDYADGIKQNIVVSGVDHLIYVDCFDTVLVSGVGNEVIRR